MQAGLKNNLNTASSRRLKFILVFSSLLLIFLNLHLWLLSYSELIDFWATIFRVSGSLNKIKESFKPHNYYLLQIHALGLQIILFCALIYSFKKPVRSFSLPGDAAHSISSVFHSIRKRLKALSKSQKFFLYSAFAIFMARNILLLFYLPFDIDEIWLYMAFKNKNPVFTLLWYPIPGNHILYSLLAHCFLKIDTGFHYLIRVPALLAGAFTFMTLFFLLHHLFRFRIAIIGLILFYSFSPVIYYSIVARGYSFNLLCTIVLINSVYRIIFYNDKRFIYIGIIASALGIFAIPTFVYNLVSVIVGWLIFIFFYKKSDFKPLIFFCLMAFLLSYLLYMPAFIFSGYSAVFNNGYVVSKTIYQIMESFGSHYSYGASWLLSGHSYDIFIIISAILLGAAFISFAKNTPHAFILLVSVIFLILPYGFSIAQRVLIPPAILTYTCFALCFILLYLFFIIDTHLHNLVFSHSLIIGLLVLTILPFHIFFKDFYEERFYRYHHANRISEILSGQAKNYFFNNTYYPYMFEFYLAKNNMLNTINLTWEADSADMITIWKKATPLHFNNSEKNYSMIYDDSTTTIYKRIKHE
jgi:hypothetical protein